MWEMNPGPLDLESDALPPDKQAPLKITLKSLKEKSQTVKPMLQVSTLLIRQATDPALLPSLLHIVFKAFDKSILERTS